MNVHLSRFFVQPGLLRLYASGASIVSAGAPMFGRCRRRVRAGLRTGALAIESTKHLRTSPRCRGPSSCRSDASPPLRYLVRRPMWRRFFTFVHTACECAHLRPRNGKSPSHSSFVSCTPIDMGPLTLHLWIPHGEGGGETLRPPNGFSRRLLSQPSSNRNPYVRNMTLRHVHASYCARS